MKKFFSLVLALVMALSLTTVAWGAMDASALQTAFNAGGDVVLNGNITATGTLTVPAGVTVNLDLAGYKIDGTGFNPLIHVKNTATLNITDSSANKSGVIELTSGSLSYAATIWLEGNLNLYAGTISMVGTPSIGYAVDVRPNSWSPQYTEGTVFHMYDGTLLSGESAVRVSSSSAADHTAVSATFIMDNGVIDGARDGVFVQSQSATYPVLTVDINNGEVSGGNNALRVYGDAATGAVGGVADPINVTLDGGEYEGAVVIKSTVTADSVDIAVSSGTFDTDVSAYVVDGKQLLANGTVVDTPAASATDPVLYKWDNAGAEWDAYFIATGDDLDDLKMDASDNCLPCYKINGEYFVEVKEAVATFKLVYGAKTVFLTPVAAEDVCYSAKASVLKVVDDEDATCGDWYVADLDEDDVYYISYDKKGVVVEGVYVAAKNGPVQILVKGKIVNVKSLAQADIKQLPHDWKGYDVVNHEYTTVKCANCGKVATLYANGTAAGKNAVKVTDNGTVLGYITAAADSFGAASAGTSTDKTVTSAETFDAGIAMYVGMSVMAAAGSVVVLKKKD